MLLRRDDTTLCYNGLFYLNISSDCVIWVVHFYSEGIWKTQPPCVISAYGCKKRTKHSCKNKEHEGA